MHFHRTMIIGYCSNVRPSSQSGNLCLPFAVCNWHSKQRAFSFSSIWKSNFYMAISLTSRYQLRRKLCCFYIHDSEQSTRNIGSVQVQCRLTLAVHVTWWLSNDSNPSAPPLRVWINLSFNLSFFCPSQSMSEVLSVFTSTVLFTSAVLFTSTWLFEENFATVVCKKKKNRRKFLSARSWRWLGTVALSFGALIAESGKGGYRVSREETYIIILGLFGLKYRVCYNIQGSKRASLAVNGSWWVMVFNGT
jgi:hypothetical protein